MAFFERIGKKITDAGQNVAQQTKNFADIAQLNSSVSEKERKISQLYTEIGQAYYEKYKDAADTDMNEQISQITALFAEIKECQEKIKQIRGIGKCPSCGADVPANAAFCNACGAKILVEETSTDAGKRHCPACGAVVAEGNAFCNQCGAKLDAPTEE